MHLHHAFFDLGVELLRLIQDKSIASLVVAKIVDVYGDRGDDLKDFLRATNPLPAGYSSLQEICALVKTDPQGKMGNAIDNVTFAITEAVPRNAGQPYIEHILKRLEEGHKKVEIRITISVTWNGCWSPESYGRMSRRLKAHTKRPASPPTRGPASSR